MKIYMDEAYVYRSRTIIPLNEANCTDKQAFDSVSINCVCRKYVLSWRACLLLFVNTGERVHLNNVKWYFGISMVKYTDKILCSQIDEIFRGNRKCFYSIRRRPEGVWSNGAGCEPYKNEKVIEELFGLPRETITCMKLVSKSRLRHEISSPTRTFGLWVGIPLKIWISVFILCLC
jgi:hypothetical protein